MCATRKRHELMPIHIRSQALLGFIEIYYIQLYLLHRVVMPNAQKWTPEEEVALCKAFINVSKDASIGTDQDAKSFWSRVTKVYCEIITTPPGSSTIRPSTALQNRWSSIINPDTKLFASLYACVRASLSYMNIYIYYILAYIVSI